MKLEVGQFARLKSGYICKIINVNDFREPNMKYGVEANYLKDIMFIGDDDIVKASYNIIDLIEEGDYVNGEKVLETNCKWEYMDDDSDTGVNEVYDGLELQKGRIYFEYEIETVVTKEQYEQMSYKVGE